MIKKNKETEELEKIYNDKSLTEANNLIFPGSLPHKNDNYIKNNALSSVIHDDLIITKPQDKEKVSVSKKDVDDYTKLLMYLYEKQKDSLREPIHKNYSDRMKPARITEPKFAYPIYPYTKGGSLSPSNGK